MGCFGVLVVIKFIYDRSKIFFEGGKRRLVDFSGVSLPFNVGDMVAISMELFGVVGAYIVLPLAFILATQLIGLTKKASKSNNREGKERRTSSRKKQQVSKKENVVNVSKTPSNQRKRSARNINTRYKSASAEEIYNYELERKKYNHLARTTLDTRQRIFYASRARQIRDSVMRKHGIILG